MCNIYGIVVCKINKTGSFADYMESKWSVLKISKEGLISSLNVHLLIREILSNINKYLCYRNGE